MSNVRKKLLIGLLLTAFSIAAVSFPTSKAGTILVEIVPSTDDVAPGEQFYVNVTISNLDAEHDLVGIEFKIQWNTTLVTGVKMELPVGHIFQTAQDADNLWTIKKTVNDTLDPNTAWYLITCSDLAAGYDAGYLPLTGSGVICKITLNATDIPGTSPLSFKPLPPSSAKVKLSNGVGESITDYTAVDSSVIVIPEFPNSIIYLILLTLSLMVAVACKKLPRKRLQTF